MNNFNTQFDEVFRYSPSSETQRKAVQAKRNVLNLEAYKQKRIISFSERLEEAEKIIRQRMDGATLEELETAICKASRVLLNSSATPMTAAIRAIGDWPQGPEAA